MSNEIIRLCFQSISLDKIFKGYELSGKQNLSDCIQRCPAWKEKALARLAGSSPRKKKNIMNAHHREGPFLKTCKILNQIQSHIEHFCIECGN